MKSKSFYTLASKFSTPRFPAPLVAAFLLTLTGAASAAPFTAGDIIVERLGDGSTALTSAAFPIALLEYKPAGTLDQTITTEFTGANLLTDSGSATSNGYLGSNGTFVAVSGSNSALATASVAALNTKASNTLGANGSVASRVIFPAGGPTGTPPSPFSGNNFRSAYPTSATTFYASGTASGSPNTGGPWYYDGANFTQLSTTVTNIRNIGVFNNQLYVSSGSGTFLGVSAVGSGTPTTAGQTTTLVIDGGTGASTYGFVLFDTDNNGSVDRAYLADDRTATGGGLRRYDFNGSVWTNNYSLLLNTTTSALVGTGTGLVGLRGLTGTWNAGTATLFATTTEASNNKLVSITDTGAAPTTFTTIATAGGANYVFRGVALSPAGGPPPAGTVSISGASINEGNGGTSILSLTVTRTNIASAFTVNYAVTGGTATSGSDFAALAPGSLNFTAGGAASQTIDITVNGDTTIESNETVALTLSGIIDSFGVTTLGTATANGTITNDDSVASSFPATGALTSTLKSNIALTGAEIPAFDPISKRAFTSTGAGIQIVDLTNPTLPVLLGNIAPTSLGVSGLTSNDVSSIAVRKGAGINPSVLAAAIISVPKSNAGYVVFLNAATGALLGSTPVGAVPDHIAFTPDGTKLLVANEGELDAVNGDPTIVIPGDTTVGSVSIIDISSGVATPSVTTADFTSYDAPATITTLKNSGVRIFQGGKPSTDFEPEYFAISADGTKAMVTLQEANAVAVLDIATATFTSVVPLGKKNFSAGRHDFTDKDGAGGSTLVNPTTGSPVFGLYMPDAVASFTSGSQTYYVTANEGDDRNDFLDPNETTTVENAGYDLDNTLFPNEIALKNQASLGRLAVSNAPGLRGDTDNDGDIDEILSYGGRSFTILDSAGAIVFDSGDMIENIIASQFFANFDDGRSDNKGPEPEGVTIANLGGRTYAFVGMERSHMVLAFDVTNPLAVTFTGGFRRTGDLNPEGLVVVSAADSPTGLPLLLVANEVSNTLTIYELTNDPFASWLGYNGFTSGGIDTDSDNDGLTDRVEFFFNQNPNNGGDFGNMPQLVPNGGAFELDFTLLNEIGATTGTLQVSTDLTSWTNALFGTDYTVASAVVNGDETAFTYALPGTGPSAPGVSPTYLVPNTATPVGASLGGVRVINQGMVGVGRVDGDSLDSFGETQGAASGLFITNWTFNAGQFSGKFQVLPDRGYNAGSIFSNYAARLHEVDFTFVPYYGAGPIAQGQILPTYNNITTKFTYQDGPTLKHTTGLNPTVHNYQLFGQTVGTVTAFNVASGNQQSLLSFDAEAVHLFDDGSGYVSDEYGAYIARFDATKKITGLTQLPEAARPHSPATTLNFSSAITPANGRRQNQGLEGMSVTPDGTRLFALLQSATIQDTGGSAQQTRNHARLFVYDVAGTNRETPVLIEEYVVRLPQFDANGNNSGLDRTAAQSEIVAIGDAAFLMLPRDGNGLGTGLNTGTPPGTAPPAPTVMKSVRLVDFASATNILGLDDDEAEAVSPGGVLDAGVNAAASAEIINMLNPADLAKFGLNTNNSAPDLNTLNEKMEGMALVPDISTTQGNDFFLFVANDNDFQSSDVKMLDASGAFITPAIDGRSDAGNGLLTNDAMFYAYKITIDAGGKKFFRFGVK